MEYVTVRRDDLHSVLFLLLHHSNGVRAHNTLEAEAADRLLAAVYSSATTVEPAKPVTVTPAKPVTVELVEPSFEPAKKATTTVKRVDADKGKVKRTSKHK